MQDEMKMFHDKCERFGKPLREIEHKDKFISKGEKKQEVYYIHTV